MNLLADQLSRIMECALPVADRYCHPLNECFYKYEINTKHRIAAFLAQVGHESGRLSKVVENLNYSADALLRTWPSRFTPELAAKLARSPEQIANTVYGGRMGNTNPGDGWRYRGRGLIQITGKNNYRACGDALGVDLLASPELLEKPSNACMSAAWFWSINRLNSLADDFNIDSITRRINGGNNGAEDRRKIYARALKAFDL